MNDKTYKKIIKSILLNDINKLNKLLNKIDINKDNYLDLYLINNLKLIFDKINNNVILLIIFNIIFNKNNYIYLLDYISNLTDDYNIVNMNKYVLIDYLIKPSSFGINQNKEIINNDFLPSSFGINQNNKNITNMIILLNIYNIKILNFIYKIDNDIFNDILTNKFMYGSHINIILNLIIIINKKFSNIKLDNYNNLRVLIRDINMNTELTMYLINNIFNKEKDLLKYNHFIQMDDYKNNIYNIFNEDNIIYENNIIIDGIIFMLSCNNKVLFSHILINKVDIIRNYKLLYFSLYYELFDITNIILFNFFNLLLFDIFELLDYSSYTTSIYFIISSKKNKLENINKEYIYIHKLLDLIKSKTYII